MLKLAIPNKGALSEGAVKILGEAGYACRRHSRELVVRDAGHEVEFIFLRPRDIAVYVGSGLIHAGITGRDLALDSKAPVTERMGLKFGRSRFCYAAPKGEGLSPDDLGGKRIATSYPNIVRADLKERGIEASTVRLDGWKFPSSLVWLMPLPTWWSQGARWSRQDWKSSVIPSCYRKPSSSNVRGHPRSMDWISSSSDLKGFW